MRDKWLYEGRSGFIAGQDRRRNGLVSWCSIPYSSVTDKKACTRLYGGAVRKGQAESRVVPVPG